MITAEGLICRYGRVVALRDASLHVPEGAIVGLLGPNGAGKTSLMRILTGQLRPSAGRAHVAGHDVVRERAALRRDIGVLFEVQNLYSRLTVDENLRLFAAIFGAPEGRISTLLEQFDLVDRRGVRVSTLSHGMRQKVLLARAFLHGPRVLFLDEPTTGLDPNWTKVVHDLVLELREQGTTILLATHHMGTADAICDTVAIVDQGRIVAHEAPSVLKKRHGRGRLELEALANGHVTREDIPLNGGAAAADMVAAALRSGTVTALHTSEASLDDVFRDLTGKSLSRVE